MLDRQLEHLSKVAKRSHQLQDVDILMIPYGDFYKHIDSFPQWLALMRKKQSDDLEADEIDPAIVARIKTNPDVGLQPTIDGSPADNMEAYLREMAAKEGGWKLMLIGKEVQLGTGHSETPEKLRHSGDSRELNYTGFGVMEWLAYSLQEQARPARPIMLTGSSISSIAFPLMAVGSYDNDESRYKLSLRPSGHNWPDAAVLPTYIHE